MDTYIEEGAFKGINFLESTLKKATYEYCSFDNCIFSECYLSNMVFVECTFTDCNFSIAHLKKLLFEMWYLKIVNLWGCVLMK
ncbi:pentapeptide repeat-containing protein [Sediminicola arcticus]|jgi:fluoroquinolone resistance protein|uniref:Pentapeptide repeat-containing protein n=1 Tax=Sediminicola arcticus TaxID=1574308 RepID=A0ABV2SQQ9_9FLAO